MKNKVMELVEKICSKESTDCRSLNKIDLARELMNLANVPQDAEIQEIPLDCNNQVVVLFLVPEYKENYYSLFAGIGTDGKFYFELSITGILKNGYFVFFEEEGRKEQILPVDYFVNKEENQMVSEYIKNLIKEKSPADRYKYVLLDRMVMDCLYYLGNGNRNVKYLWSKDETEHVANMKALWSSFPEDEKPEWLSMEEIEKFEKEMITS